MMHLCCKRAWLVCLLMAVALMTSAPRAAHAQGDKDSPASAAELKKTGDEAMMELRYDDALAAYDKAFELEPSPVFRYNRGRALQALNRFPEALDELEAFDREAPDELKARVPGLEELIIGVRGKVATVEVVSDPPGARVLIRDKLMGKTPLAESLRVNAGPATIEVVKDGYQPFTKTVDLPGGGVARIEAKLAARSKIGVLVVTSQAGASAYVDDRAIGVVPAETQVTAGEHNVRVQLDGYDDAESTAVVVAGKRKEINVEMSESTPLYAQWWLWTGVGTVVVAAVVVAVVVTAEGPADEGDIPPGQVKSGSLTIFSW
jgi:hypothetical protein